MGRPPGYQQSNVYQLFHRPVPTTHYTSTSSSPSSSSS
jgi:hypothetical protein